jgi:hypothetical protein
MRQEYVTQRQNKQIMEGNEWETERFPIRQETHTQRHAIPANSSYFIAFPTLRSNRRRQREGAHTLHIDVGTTTLPSSSLRLLSSPQSQQTAASPRQEQRRRRRYVLVFRVFFSFWKNSKKFAFLLCFRNRRETDAQDTGVARELRVRLRSIRAFGCASETDGKQIHKRPESPESSASDFDASELPDVLRKPTGNRSTRHRSRQRAPRPTPTHASFRMRLGEEEEKKCRKKERKSNINK